MYFYGEAWFEYLTRCSYLFTVILRLSLLPLLCKLCCYRSGTKQLFSQGMADLLLDACSDFWDGHDVRPLGDEERFDLI
jgi:hypothetical protein